VPAVWGYMRSVAFIDQLAVVEEILFHLGLWPGSSHRPLDGAAA
jgi:hypothetical protein